MSEEKKPVRKASGVVQAISRPKNISTKEKAFYKCGIKVDGDWFNKTSFSKTELEKVLEGIEKGTAVIIDYSEDDYGLVVESIEKHKEQPGEKIEAKEIVAIDESEIEDAFAISARLRKKLGLSEEHWFRLAISIWIEKNQVKRLLYRNRN